MHVCHDCPALPMFVSLARTLQLVLAWRTRLCRLSQYYQNPVFDSMAGVSIAGLLGVMGLVLTEVRRREMPQICVHVPSLLP